MERADGQAVIEPKRRQSHLEGHVEASKQFLIRFSLVAPFGKRKI
jgi:hypothetical protein